MKLLVVTVNYRTATHVLRSLDALVPQLEALGDAEAWVVDNASPDDSVEVLRDGIARRGFGSRVRLIASRENGGFGAGNNIAFREALALPTPPDAFYLLNPDATPDHGTVGALVEHLRRHPEVGIVGSRLRGTDGSAQCSTFRFPSVLGEIESNARIRVVSQLLERHRIWMDPPEAACPVDWVSGASMMIRRSTLESVGLFDEKFFLYFEEVDLCRRVREAGFAIHFEPAACVEHVNGAATGVTEQTRRLPKYWFDSRAHYHRKASGEAGLLAINTAALGALCLFRARDLVAGRRWLRPYLMRDFVRYNFLPTRFH